MSSTSDRRDPKPDVVTGYPAAAAPPAGTAYPYTAPPPNAAPYYSQPNLNPNPNPNGYYPNYNPNYNGYYSNQNPSAGRNLFLRRFIAVAVAVFVIIGAVTFIVWLILRPKLPDFSLSRLDVSSFNISSSSSLTADFALDFAVRNPNSKMSISYDDVSSGVLYGSDELAQTTMFPFDQRTGEVTNIKAKLAAVGAYIEEDVVNEIRADRVRGDGVVNFNVRLVSIVKFRSGAWRTRRHFLRVFCDDVGVKFKNSTAGSTSGSMVGTVSSCQVGL